MMSIVGWTAILGAVGAAIARANGDRWYKGFLLSILIPVAGWYVTWAVTREESFD
jgi:hypothetical protein